MTACPLCAEAGLDVLWRDDLCRVILVDDADYPGFCRVILNRHVKEMTDLGEAERTRLMAVVFAVEAAVRAVLAPDKVNLASLGNMVPHLHWHVIPRFAGDRHFPDAIWAPPRRAAGPAAPADAVRPRLSEALAQRLGPSPG
ncbi:HIT family protein [Parasulfuritortus cantonensis]|uniref:HIT family protein n=1 Tax=Parasulfuritortus cantonensis TaxID=2528202 RepID=A0A4R1BIR9_9PROT|nr:HIT family protein [Parasulfuritortus cantonensis]TCJ17161.1 HIT family protein [Parasulfuritortus cantonensis]